MEDLTHLHRRVLWKGGAVEDLTAHLHRRVLFSATLPLLCCCCSVLLGWVTHNITYRSFVSPTLVSTREAPLSFRKDDNCTICLSTLRPGHCQECIDGLRQPPSVAAWEPLSPTPDLPPTPEPLSESMSEPLPSTPELMPETPQPRPPAPEKHAPVATPEPAMPVSCISTLVVSLPTSTAGQ